MALNEMPFSRVLVMPSIPFHASLDSFLQQAQVMSAPNDDEFVEFKTVLATLALEYRVYVLSPVVGAWSRELAWPLQLLVSPRGGGAEGAWFRVSGVLAAVSAGEGGARVFKPSAVDISPALAALREPHGFPHEEASSQDLMAHVYRVLTLLRPQVDDAVALSA